MRKIDKNAEPKEWTEYRLTPGVDYQSTPELRDSLLKEQGYLCAYCMRRIPTKDENSNETSRIDHILSRTKRPDLKLDYQNMVICCPGAIDAKFHCDKLKGEENVTFNLFDDTFISTISYKTKDGAISSSIDKYASEIENLLHLNHPLLKKNRQQTLTGVIRSLNQKKTPWKKAEIQKYLTNWNNKNQEGQYRPYCGIVIWYLNKKMK
jgi:uncharacterized protein (TIGR02646 family)